MKALIFSVIFILSNPVFSNEIPDVGPQIATTVKEVEVTNLLTNSSEFKECRKLYEIKAGASQTERDKNLSVAQDCFKRKMNDVKDPKKLERLSEELGLQSYGLVKGNNVNEIQQYLDKKMYKALTGVDLDAEMEDRIKAQAFKNRKQVDQSVFISLYKTQLNKNALFELSRFCFNNFRSTNTASQGKNTFGEHWAHLANMPDAQIKSELELNSDDSGNPPFIQGFNDTTKKDQIFQDIFKGINIKNGNGSIPVSKLSSFFTYCGRTIPILCKKFQDSKAKANLQAGQNVTSESNIGDPSTASTNTSVGAHACLAKARLQELKVAIEKSQKTEEAFDKLAADPGYMKGLIDNRETQINHFVAGENGNESIDNLTNYTSGDMLSGNSNDDVQKKIDDCKQSPEVKKCDGLLISKDDFDKARQQTEIEMTAKREVEIARVRQIYNDNRAKLEEYLKEKGYFELAGKAQSITEAELELAIGQEYEARKIATLAEINKSFGSRQISENEAKSATLDSNIDAAGKQTKEERARLAQVVLFNNIVTSNLSIFKNGKEVGRNVNAWEKERASLENSKVNESLFSNLNSTGSGKTSSAVGGQDELGGLQFINKILGDTSQP